MTARDADLYSFSLPSMCRVLKSLYSSIVHISNQSNRLYLSVLKLLFSQLLFGFLYFLAASKN